MAEAFATGSIAPHAAAVSALQAVPFAVNAPVLNAVRWLYELDADIKVKGIPDNTDLYKCLGSRSDQCPAQLPSGAF